MKYNPKIMSYIRDDWIRKQMISREADFTEYHPLNIFVGTWNVNGKKSDEDISGWLCGEGGSKTCDVRDIIKYYLNLHKQKKTHDL